MSTQRTATHEDLIAFVERELELVGQGRYEDVAELALARADLLASLPTPPPEEARSPLHRAAMLQESVTIELLRQRELTLLQLRHIEHALRAAQGYGAAAHMRHPSQITASA